MNPKTRQPVTFQDVIKKPRNGQRIPLHAGVDSYTEQREATESVLIFTENTGGNAIYVGYRSISYEYATDSMPVDNM